LRLVALTQDLPFSIPVVRSSTVTAAVSATVLR
jgi:hypothetical protein